MSRGVNKVILVGHLGSDPDIKYMPSGSAVVNVSLATTDAWKDKETGEKREKTEWHRLVFFGKLAEIVAEYTRKGSQIYAEGRLQTRKWQDKEGNDHYTTEIICNDMQMLGGKSSRKESTAKEYAAASGGTVAPPQDDFPEDDIPW